MLKTDKSGYGGLAVAYLKISVPFFKYTKNYDTLL